jgi:cysteine desulfurase
MNLPKENIEGAIRLSFSGMNNEEQAYEFIDAIKEIIPIIKY